MGSSGKVDVSSVSILTRPLTTLRLFALVLVDFVVSAARTARAHIPLATFLLCGAAAWSYGQHHLPANVIAAQDRIFGELAFATYWIVLGVLSSVGLGSGLHTGLLALIPHVIRVTTTALRLGTTDFSAKIVSYGAWPKKLDLASLSEAISPHYAENAWTPRSEAASAAAGAEEVSFVSIASKVAWAAFLWGLGTALGELPPYFIARAAAASGKGLEELEDVESLEAAAEKSKNKKKQGLVDRGKIFLYESVQRYGFVAVLLAASIPNPLFDLAGLTCGHFGIPFATFFGATLLGKAVFKVSIQVLFIIATVKYGAAAFEGMRAWLAVALPGWTRLHGLLDSMERSIHAGQHGMCTTGAASSAQQAHALYGGSDAAGGNASSLQSYLKAVVDKCHACCTGHFHGAAADRCSVACQTATSTASSAASAGPGSTNGAAGGAGAFDAGQIGKQLWGLFLLAMVGYFVVSLVNSLAQQKLNELREQEQSKATKSSGAAKKPESAAKPVASSAAKRVRASSAARAATPARAASPVPAVAPASPAAASAATALKSAAKSAVKSAVKSAAAVKSAVKSAAKPAAGGGAGSAASRASMDSLVIIGSSGEDDSDSESEEEEERPKSRKPVSRKAEVPAAVPAGKKKAKLAAAEKGKKAAKEDDSEDDEDEEEQRVATGSVSSSSSRGRAASPAAKSRQASKSAAAKKPSRSSKAVEKPEKRESSAASSSAAAGKRPTRAAATSRK